MSVFPSPHCATTTKLHCAKPINGVCTKVLSCARHGLYIIVTQRKGSPTDKKESKTIANRSPWRISTKACTPPPRSSPLPMLRCSLGRTCAAKLRASSAPYQNPTTHLHPGGRRGGGGGSTSVAILQQNSKVPHHVTEKFKIGQNQDFRKPRNRGFHPGPAKVG